MKKNKSEEKVPPSKWLLAAAGTGALSTTVEEVTRNFPQTAFTIGKAHVGSFKEENFSRADFLLKLEIIFTQIFYEISRKQKLHKIFIIFSHKQRFIIF